MSLELRMDGVTCKSEFLNHSAQYNHKRRLVKQWLEGVGHYQLMTIEFQFVMGWKVYLGVSESMYLQ